MTATMMTDPEQAAILAIQQPLGEAKAALRKSITACTAMMKIQEDAGRTDAYNTAFRLRGMLRRELGQIEVDHADASSEMLALFSNSGPVVFGGGGGR